MTVRCLSEASSPLPPHSPEAERGVLGCCLLDPSKTTEAVKAGVTRRWFFELRNAEIFSVLASLAADGGGDFVMATLLLRERGKLDGVGGLAYLDELQNSVPSSENLPYYIPELQAYFQRRQILDATTRLQMFARDPMVSPTSVLADVETVLQLAQRQSDPYALPDIISASDLVAADLPILQAHEGAGKGRKSAPIGHRRKMGENSAPFPKFKP